MALFLNANNSHRLYRARSNPLALWGINFKASAQTILSQIISQTRDLNLGPCQCNVPVQMHCTLWALELSHRNRLNMRPSNSLLLCCLMHCLLFSCYPAYTCWGNLCNDYFVIVKCHMADDVNYICFRVLVQGGPKKTGLFFDSL